MKIIPLREQTRYNGKMPYGITKIIKGNELSLYIMLLEYHNTNYGHAFPTYEDIRKYFGKGWDNKRIRGYLKGLEDKGLIVIGKNNKKSGYANNIYMLNVPCFEDENVLIKKLQVIEHDIEKIDGHIELYKNSLNDNNQREEFKPYLINEIKKYEQEKKSLLVAQQELLIELKLVND